MTSVRLYDAKIPSNVSYVGKTVSDIVSCVQEVYGKLDDSVLFEIRVILNELLLNAIKHGNCEKTDRHVRVAAGIAKEYYAFFLIEDEGQGCDHKRLLTDKKCAMDIDNLFDIKETGRGMLIVKNLCDAIKYNKKGNKVLIVKRLYH